MVGDARDATMIDGLDSILNFLIPGCVNIQIRAKIVNLKKKSGQHKPLPRRELQCISGDLLKGR